MKKNYQHPWLKVVVIDECDIVCESPEVASFNVRLDDYNTYVDPIYGGNNGTNNSTTSGTNSDF